MSQTNGEYEDDGGGVSWVVILVVAVVVAAAAAFFAGRALAGDSGPATLSEAVEQAQAGDLPCGETGEAPTPAADGQGGPPAGGFGQGGAPNADFIVRAVCNNGEGGMGGGQGGPPGGRGGPGGGGFNMQVKSVEGSTLTVTGPQGDMTFEIGPETTVSRATAGDAADLQAGQNVIVMGGRQQGEAATSVLITATD